jgi:hypothetical protein
VRPSLMAGSQLKLLALRPIMICVCGGGGSGKVQDCHSITSAVCLHGSEVRSQGWPQVGEQKTLLLFAPPKHRWALHYKLGSA